MQASGEGKRAGMLIAVGLAALAVAAGVAVEAGLRASVPPELPVTEFAPRNDTLAVARGDAFLFHVAGWAETGSTAPTNPFWLEVYRVEAGEARVLPTRVLLSNGEWTRPFDVQVDGDGAHPPTNDVVMVRRDACGCLEGLVEPSGDFAGAGETPVTATVRYDLLEALAVGARQVGEGEARLEWTIVREDG